MDQLYEEPRWAEFGRQGGRGQNEKLHSEGTVECQEFRRYYYRGEGTAERGRMSVLHNYTKRILHGEGEIDTSYGGASSLVRPLPLQALSPTSLYFSPLLDSA